MSNTVVTAGSPHLTRPIGRACAWMGEIGGSGYALIREVAAPYPVPLGAFDLLVRRA